MVHILDLHFKLDTTIAAFIVESSDGLILIETGPYSTFETLQKQLEKHTFYPEEIKHVLLTHIHFDHAGAAWALAKEGAKIYVHPVGYPHLISPEKLYNSAKRIYGDQMEALWGEMNPIPEQQLRVVKHNEHIRIGDQTFTALHTPGHASHHIAWEWNNVIFAGDVAGVVIGEENPVVPPCPPPDINIEHWNESLDLLESKQPKTLYLTHFGPVHDVPSHLNQLRYMINDWAQWMKPHWEKGEDPQDVIPTFQRYVVSQLRGGGLSEEMIERYEAANPVWMSVAGLLRYWKKRKEFEEEMKKKS